MQWRLSKTVKIIELKIPTDIRVQQITRATNHAHNAQVYVNKFVVYNKFPKVAQVLYVNKTYFYFFCLP